VTSAEFFQGLSLLAAAVSGASMLLFPNRWRSEQSGRRERALQERMLRGEDAYFEELRTLKAYRQPLNPRTVRIFGAVLLLLPATALFLLFFRPW